MACLACAIWCEIGYNLKLFVKEPGTQFLCFFGTHVCKHPEKDVSSMVLTVKCQDCMLQCGSAKLLTDAMICCLFTYVCNCLVFKEIILVTIG